MSDCLRLTPYNAANQYECERVCTIANVARANANKNTPTVPASLLFSVTLEGSEQLRARVQHRWKPPSALRDPSQEAAETAGSL